MMIYRKITINCVKDNLLREKVTQQEHGAVNFAFTVMNGRELIDLTECQQAVYYGTKPDGHVSMVQALLLRLMMCLI